MFYSTPGLVVDVLDTPAGVSPAYKYFFAPIKAQHHGVLYSIEAAFPTNILSDPSLTLVAFNNPKAALSFVTTNLDSSFTWPQSEAIPKLNASLVTSPALGRHIITSGVASFNSTSVLNAPLTLIGNKDIGHENKPYMLMCANSGSGQAGSQDVMTVVGYTTSTTLITSDSVVVTIITGTPA